MEKEQTTAKRKPSVFVLVFAILFTLCVAGSAVLAASSRGRSFAQTMFIPVYKDDLYYDAFMELVSEGAEPENAHGLMTFLDLFLHPPGADQDTFMDFYNSIRDASTLDVYSRGVIYPPLANLFFFVLSKFVPQEVASATIFNRYAMQVNAQAMMLYVFFAVFCILMLAFMIRRYLIRRDGVVAAYLLSFAVIVTYPMYYCLERGNIILLSMILTAFFVFFHDSENKVVRECSYIALALAAGLKIYPAVFGLILLQKKQYKAALRTLLYGAAAFFLPFAAYHFQDGLLQLIDNLMQFSRSNKQGFVYGSVSVTNILYYFGLDGLVMPVFVIYEAVAAIGVFLVPKTWQRYALMAVMLVNISSVSSSYALIFFVIPFLVFLSSETEKSKSDWVYFALFCLLLLPLPCVFFYHPEWVQGLFERMNVPVTLDLNKLISLPVVQALFLWLTVDGIANFIRRVRGVSRVRSSQLQVNNE